MSDARIRTVAVVGHGIAAWSTAAALKKRVPGLAVALVPVAAFRPGLVDLTGAAAPSVGDFHRDIGLAETDVVVRTGAAFRLGARFTGWSGDGSDYVHAYGPAGQPIERVSFAPLWMRDGGDAPFDAFSPGAALARAGRFVPAGGVVPGGYAHGLHLDSPTYARFIESYARHLGVVVTAAPFAELLVAERRVSRLRLADASELTADLYVDATNAAGALIGALDGAWQDWSRWLPCDHVVLNRARPDADLAPVDEVTTLPTGWRATADLPTHRQTIDVQAGRSADASGTDVTFRSGRRPHAWIGNVVAVGEAHSVIEPLEAAPLHLLHAQIDRLVATLPDRSFAAVELAHYNRVTNEEADRMRDFVILHYATSDRPEPFWRAVREVPPPDLLAETLALFRERGRLPIRDGESFDRDSWHAVLFGQGVQPRRVDVLAQAVEPAQARAAMDAFRHRLAAAVATAPLHRDYLAGLRIGA